MVGTRGPTNCRRRTGCLVQIATAESLEIEGDVAVPGRAQALDNLPASRNGTGEFGLVDLDPRRLTVMTHPHLTESEVVQHALGPIDTRQDFDRNRSSIGNPARQTRGSRLVPRTQAKATRRFANVGFGEASAAR